MHKEDTSGDSLVPQIVIGKFKHREEPSRAFDLNFFANSLGLYILIPKKDPISFSLSSFFKQ